MSLWEIYKSRAYALWLWTDVVAMGFGQTPLPPQPGPDGLTGVLGPCWWTPAGPAVTAIPCGEAGPRCLSIGIWWLLKSSSGT